MFDPTDSGVLWLNLTNIALGAVTIICLVVVGTIVFREVAARARKRVAVPVYRDDHAFVLSDLGITMADGGDRLDEKVNAIKGGSRSTHDDESNIIRSNN